MPLSGWFIDDIELPLAPDSDEKTVTRSFQSETLFNFFPQITKSSARAFDYTITGIVYPRLKVELLEEIARSADTNIVILTIPAPIGGHLATKFAVKTFRVFRKGPLFVKDESGIDQAAYPFEMTFTELPDEGEFQDGVDGFTDTDEESLGLSQLNELNDAYGPQEDLDDFGPTDWFQLITGLPYSG